MNTQYYAKADKISEMFSFVIDYGLKLEREETLKYGSYVEYVGNGIRLYLGFDFKDYFFYFNFIRGENTKYPNDNDQENIKTFWDLAYKYVPNLNIEELKPDEEEGYFEALTLNADLLNKYGSKILTGEEWF